MNPGATTGRSIATMNTATEEQDTTYGEAYGKPASKDNADRLASAVSCREPRAFIDTDTDTAIYIIGRKREAPGGHLAIQAAAKPEMLANPEPGLVRLDKVVLMARCSDVAHPRMS